MVKPKGILGGHLNMLKNFKHKDEVLVFGDFNINWLDKHYRKKFLNLASKHDVIQMIEAPTRITRNTQTLIDLIFANKPDRIIKTYNLVTGLSDHNMILIARKLTKKRMTRFLNPNQNSFKLVIPCKKLTEFENELKGVNWDELQQYDQVNDYCNKLMSTIESTVDKYIKKRKKIQRKFQLSWMNNNIRKLMKRRDLLSRPEGTLILNYLKACVTKLLKNLECPNQIIIFKLYQRLKEMANQFGGN